MHLIEVFLPITDNKGQRFEGALYAHVRTKLTDKFSGMTSFSRAPAQGITDDHGSRVHDELIVIEVMADTLDRTWWSDYRAELEKLFRQNEILIRASEVTKL